MWPVRLYNIFAHYAINGMIFGGGEGGFVKRKMYVLIFATILTEIFSIIKRMAKEKCWRPYPREFCKV